MPELRPPVPAALVPREGMMAVVRNRRALVTSVQPFEADERGRLHLVELECTDGLGAETDRLLWEVEPAAELLEPSALPRVAAAPPMAGRELDAMVRAARWSALTPSLPFSGLREDRPPLAAPLYRDPLYRSYGKQAALAWQQEQFAADAAFEERWLAYLAGFKDAGNFVRHAASPFGDARDEDGRCELALVPSRPEAT
jgi:hypothetical protein